MITKGERSELKAIVRNQFRVLRSEVIQRQAELHTQLDDEIAERYAEDDRKWANVTHRVHEAVLACNREINNALYEEGYQARQGTEHMWITAPRLDQPRGERFEVRQQAWRKIEAQMKEALLRLDRQEADLLRTLAVGAIESEEAQAFLAAIPTVGELVPAARLIELEAGLDD